MNKVPCEVIRDLFPSYIDGLTSEVTNQLIEEHLKECEDCRAVLASMRGPENAPENTLAQMPEEQKEIDFLKKNKKKNRMILLFSILGALALVLLVLLVRTFLVGNKNYTTWAPMHLEVQGKELSFDAIPTDSASAIAALNYTEDHGIVTIYARSVLVSPLYRGSRHGSYTAEEDIREVRAGDRIVWSEGASVSAQAAELFETRHAYIGDMSANQRTANALNMSSYLGPYTSKLKTKNEPYGWEFLLQNDIPEERIIQYERDMHAFAVVLIGLIGNLDHVTYEYTVDGKTKLQTYTAEIASLFFGEDIKICSTSIHALDKLIKKTGLSMYAYPVETEGEEDQVWIQIINQSESALASLGFACYKNGELCSSGGITHADESPIEIGEITDCSMDAMEFGGTWDENAVLEVEISLETESGKSVTVPGRIRITADTGSVHQFILTGNEKDGYRLEQ